MSALSDDTKLQIRLYLGWPQRYRQSDSGLEQALNYVDTDTVLQSEITGSILPALQAVDTALTNAQTRLKFEVAGELKTRTSEIAWLRSEGRRHVGRLSSIIAVPVMQDVFSGETSSAGSLGGTRRGGHMKIG